MLTMMTNNNSISNNNDSNNVSTTSNNIGNYNSRFEKAPKYDYSRWYGCKRISYSKFVSSLATNLVANVSISGLCTNHKFFPP